MSRISLKERLQFKDYLHAGSEGLVSATRTVKFSDLKEVPSSFLKGTVVVCIADPIDLIKCLISLDGVVDRIILLPRNFRHEHLEDNWAYSEIDWLIADQDFLDGLSPAKFRHFTPEIYFKKCVGELPESTTDTQWLIATSGTTGRPKFVVSNLGSLAGRVPFSNSFSTKPPRWALLYEPTRFAGVQVLLRSLLSGDVLVVPDLSVPLDEQIEFLIGAGVTHASATPTLWRKILMSNLGRSLALKQVVLGGEAADQTVLDSLSRTFKGARVTHVYASTEAGLGLWSSDGQAGFPLTYLDAEFDGVSVKIDQGRLFLRSDRAASRYVDDEIPARDGWVDTGDLVEIQGSRFYVVGRANNTINVGGNKVLPEKVRQVLLASGFVTDAVVFGRPNPFTGFLVAAKAKPVPGLNVIGAAERLKAYCGAHLEPYEIPRIVNWVEEIKTGPTGKAENQLED